MHRSTFHYIFDEKVSMLEVNDHLTIAHNETIEVWWDHLAECEPSPYVDEKKHTCSIDGTGHAGQLLACIFTGRLVHHLGTHAFTVEQKITSGAQS